MESREGQGLRLSFGAPVAGISALFVLFFLLFTEYSDSLSTDEHINQYYMWYIHVIIMVFVGFGWLMTFLRRYSYSAVALNYFTSALVMLEFILVGGAVQQLWHEDGGSQLAKIEVDMPLMIDAAFCAASAMITFGAVLGKTTPTQLVMLLVLEVPLYAVNQKLVFEYLKGLDIGGSMTIHVFGAYYGLAASLLLSKPGSGSEHTKNKSSYVSDVTSMVGTVFLFIFWPSFNGALASNPEFEEMPVQTQFYCVVNTAISLLGAIVVVFACSAIFGGKLNMFHIQNATLAGGVAMGSSANLKIQPGGALTIGTIAGVLSTSGFEYLMPYLEKRIGLRDTCGVHNLHGMPGILGGLAAALASSVAYSANSGLLDTLHGDRTYQYQFASLACTLGMAIVGGFLAAAFINLTTPKSQVLSTSKMFEDDVTWHHVEADDDDASDVEAGATLSQHIVEPTRAEKSLYENPCHEKSCHEKSCHEKSRHESSRHSRRETSRNNESSRHEISSNDKSRHDTPSRHERSRHEPSRHEGSRHDRSSRNGRSSREQRAPQPDMALVERWTSESSAVSNVAP